jgi:hypothetical protein
MQEAYNYFDVDYLKIKGLAAKRFASNFYIFLLFFDGFLLSLIWFPIGNSCPE